MKSLENIKNTVASTIKNGGAENTIMTYLFSHIRIVLEKKSKKSKYPYLSMVCNWYQHYEIDKSILGYEIIQKVGDIILDEIAYSGPRESDHFDKLIVKVSNAIEVGRLQQDMRMFFKDFNVNPIFVNDKNWHNTIVCILNDLSERPLRIPELPNKPSKKLTNQQKHAKRVNEYLERKAMQTFAEEPHFVTPVAFSIKLDQNRRFCWVVQMRAKFTLTGALLMK
ncbi:hypothetical protein HYO49_13485 [Vibrio parahaemolyticus]|nr:hypothetical protein [Vibrio parahaemolyticus]